MAERPRRRQGDVRGRLRADVPTLEPDDLFVARLAEAAAASHARATRPRRAVAGWRVAFAAAGVGGVAVLGTWAAASVTEPDPPTRPVTPASDPASPTPGPTSPTSGDTEPGGGTTPVTGAPSGSSGPGGVRSDHDRTGDGVRGPGEPDTAPGVDHVPGAPTQPGSRGHGRPPAHAGQTGGPGGAGRPDQPGRPADPGTVGQGDEQGRAERDADGHGRDGRTTTPDLDRGEATAR